MLGVESHGEEYGKEWEVVSTEVELGAVTEDLVKYLYATSSPEYAAEVVRWWFLSQSDIMNNEYDVRFERKNGSGKDVWIYSQDD